jgi:hypothetical protein
VKGGIIFDRQGVKDGSLLRCFCALRRLRAERAKATAKTYQLLYNLLASLKTIFLRYMTLVAICYFLKGLVFIIFGCKVAS